MRASIPAIKCREAIGRLRKHGIEASRNTGWDRGTGEPDAFLTTAEGDAWLVKIWTGDSLEPRLFDDVDAPSPLDETVRQFRKWKGRQSEGGHPTTPGLMVFAPALDDDRLGRSENLSVDGERVAIVAHRRCAKPETIAEAIHSFSSVSDRLPEEAIAQWRAAAIPEVQIEAPAHIRRRIERTPEIPVAPLLLDYDQERCARLDLEMDDGLREMAGDLRVRVVTGVAGCGKTLVLLHRAALLARHFPNDRVLIVSHNRPLIADLGRRLRRRKSEGARGRIQCLTFLQWLRHVAPPRGELLPWYETHRWIEKRRQADDFAALKNRSNEWIGEEIGWMFDHGLSDESYLTAERRGRGTGLQEPQRRAMLALSREYRAYLRASNLSDWTEWPLSVWEHPEILERQPKFDHLLIDEAQFFAPVWIDLLRRSLKPGGHLYLCADPTQGFLRRRLSWAQLGLAVRNRSHRLERPYRSTRAILEFAEQFYRRRLPDDDEPLNLPSPAWLESIPSGQAPIVLPGGSGEDQLGRLLRELKSFHQGGGNLADVLVLVAGRNVKTEAVIQRICRSLSPDAAAELKDDQFPEAAAGVAHLMAATGLERPVVFLLGIDELANEEANPALDEDERREKIRDHTRQIYVGITRAMERLIVFASAGVLVEGFASPGES